MWTPRQILEHDYKLHLMSSFKDPGKKKKIAFKRTIRRDKELSEHSAPASVNSHSGCSITAISLFPPPLPVAHNRTTSLTGHTGSSWTIRGAT